MSRRVQGLVGLAALGVAALTLIVVELAQGARDYGELAVANPCTATVSVSGEGLDATAQQILLDGLNGAACELGTTREELVLSFEPELGADIPWDQETIERAVRSGLLNSIDEAEDRGSIGGLSATVLRELIERAPLDLLSRAAGRSPTCSARLERSLDLLQRAALRRLHVLTTGLGDRIRHHDDELAVGRHLVRRLRLQRRDGGAERVERRGLDLLRRVGEPEARAPHLGKLADELAELFSRASLRCPASAPASLNVSKKPRSASETRRGRPGHALLHGLPFLLGEVGFACHLRPPCRPCLVRRDYPSSRGTT